MRKKKSRAMLAEAVRIRADVEQAAELTNRPEKACELAAQWYGGIESGGKPSTFGLVTQDIAGILMIAHDEAPERFGAERAAEAVGLSSALTGERPVSLRGAATRWQSAAAGESPTGASSTMPLIIGPTRSGKTPSDEQWAEWRAENDPQTALTTALDAVVCTTNYGRPEGHVSETSIRAAPDDDRVLWIVTDYDDTIVLGGFFAPPELNDEDFDNAAIIAQTHMVYAMADRELVRRADQRNAAIAEAVEARFRRKNSINH